MPVPSKSSLRAFFSTFASVRAQFPKAAGSLYESFIYLETCAAAKQAGFGVRMIAPGGVFVFRASPGNLGAGFGHTILTSASNVHYQLHNGIEVLGHSGMKHEADIVLLNNWTRPVSIHGPSNPLSLTIECKLYSSAARLKGEARKVIGMVTDWAHQSHPSQKSSRLQGCLHCGKSFEALFATSVRGGLRPDIETFLATYDVEPCFGAFSGVGGLASLRSKLSSAFSMLS